MRSFLLGAKGKDLRLGSVDRDQIKGTSRIRVSDSFSATQNESYESTTTSRTKKCNYSRLLLNLAFINAIYKSNCFPICEPFPYQWRRQDFFREGDAPAT